MSFPVSRSAMFELRSVFRSLRRAPGFTLAMIVTLALGIGACTAVFSAMDQAVFRKPHPHYGRLAMFGLDDPNFGFISNSYPVQVVPCMTQGKSFEAFAISAWGRGTLGTGNETFGVDFGRVNSEFFSVLGSKPALGRLFAADDFKPGAEDVMVIPTKFWKENFGSDPKIIGKTVVFEGHSYRIVGVLSKDFSAPEMMGSNFYTPMVPEADFAKPFRYVYSAMARLRPNITLAQANAEVAVLGAAKEATPRFQERFKETLIHLKWLSDIDQRTEFGRIHGVFLGAVAFLYAIAGLNAINLLLVRLSARRRELGVRHALGGSRCAILRALGLESLILAVASGFVGLLVAQILMPTVLSILSSRNPDKDLWLHLDGRALIFGFGFSLFTSALLVLVPAWRTLRMDPQQDLKEGGTVLGEGPGLRRLREGLVVLGAAMALVLLTGTGLMTRSVRQLMKVDRGFDPRGKLALWVDLPRALQAPDVRHDLSRRLEERLCTVPGIRNASIANTIPLAGMSSIDLQKPDGTMAVVGFNPVSPGYLKGLGMKLLKGRWLPERPEGPAGVVVLNAAMAKDWFGAEDPIGRRLSMGNDRSWEVIGLVMDTRDDVRGKAYPQYYFPYWQDGNRADIVSLLLDFPSKPTAAFLQSVRRIIHDVEPLAGVRSPTDLEENARLQISREQVTLVVLQLISMVALILAALGLFSVMAYTVSRRMNEFGIRSAMGADPKQIFRSILRRGLMLTSLGIGIGLVCSWALTRFIRSLLFETSPLDIPVYASMSILLLGVASLACWLPARRAAHAEPAGLLRSE